MIDLALLGAGRIGKVHAEAISTIGDVRLKYVFDPVEEAACSVIEQCGAVAASLEHILDDHDIRGADLHPIRSARGANQAISFGWQGGILREAHFY